MVQESITIGFTVVNVSPGSLDVDFMGLLGSLAAAVDQIAPPHNFSRSMHYRVNLLANQVQQIASLAEWKHVFAHLHKPLSKYIQAGQIF
jgi:hypothetical protein